MRALIGVWLFLMAQALATVSYAEESYPLKTMTLESVEVPLLQVLDGTVEAINRSTVSAQTSGRVLEINYDVDDFVEKGAVLVRLHSTSQQADLDSAKAGLDGANSRYIEARDEQKRVAELYKKKLLSKSKLDAANATLASTQSTVKSAQARLRQAEEQLSNTVIKAPYSGIVIERSVEPGEIATSGQPLMTGISLEKLRVSVSVPQRVITAVREAGRATILFDNGHSIESDDIVFFPYADPQTNSFRVRIQMDESVEGIFPGMYTKVAFTLGTVERLLVPSEAIAYRSELTGIYVVGENGKVRLRQVRLGKQIADKVEILAGAEAGQVFALNPTAAGIFIKASNQNITAGE